MTINAHTVNRLLSLAPGARTPLKAGRVLQPCVAAVSVLLLGHPFFFSRLHALLRTLEYRRPFDVTTASLGDSWEAAEGRLLPDEESHFCADLHPELLSMQQGGLF